MEGRSAVYRGVTRVEAERTYHDDARRAAAEGYVPTSEEWSAALGQQVLTVNYVHLPEQASAVLAALRDIETQPGSSSAQVSAAPSTVVPNAQWTAPDRRNRNNRVIGIGIFVVLVVALAIAGSGHPDSSPNAAAPAATSAAKHLTGKFLSWQAVDDAHGYAFFSITNSGTTTETATCTISVEDDFGDFGFDALVGEPVGPGKTISGNIPLSVGKGSFLINRGEVKDC